MSGPIVRTGATPKFSENWDKIFGDKKKQAKSTKKKADAKASKKSTKKKAKKKK